MAASEHLDELNVIVYGPPQSMGSKRAFISKHGRAYVVDQNYAALRTFQDSLRAEMQRVAPAAPHVGPMYVRIIAVLARPKSHYGTGRYAGTLKTNAPKYSTTKPDIDKIARAVLDCGAGIWYRDDSQVCDLTVSKLYTDADQPHPCVVVSARALNHEETHP